jgi:hypothetical protein
MTQQMTQQMAYRTKGFALVVVLATIFSSTAHAWGNEGHRIIGYIAASLLSDTARQQLRQLLGDVDLAHIANELDDNREVIEQRHPGASRWHYENRSICGNEISCPQGQCVTQQIERYLRVLKDKRATGEQRVEAIVIVVHLVGDLHQPLHLSDNRDRGGNDVWVLLPRDAEPHRLHEVWDTRLVKMNMQRRAPSKYAQFLMRDFDAKFADWRSGNVQSWAAETHRLGSERAYRALPNFECAIRAHNGGEAIPLQQSYVDASRKVVAEQLAKAGVRLAATLNAAFEDTH